MREGRPGQGMRRNAPASTGAGIATGSRSPAPVQPLLERLRVTEPTADLCGQIAEGYRINWHGVPSFDCKIDGRAFLLPLSWLDEIGT